MKSYAKNWILKASLILVFLAIDLISKYLLESHFESGGDVITIIPKVFNLEYVKNTGISFGMFKNSVVASLILPILFLCLFGVYDAFEKNRNILYSFGFSLIIAGALGNLYDRILLKFVRDFFAFSFFPFVFNFADACITVGFILLLVSYIIALSKRNKPDGSNKKTESVSGKESQVDCLEKTDDGGLELSKGKNSKKNNKEEQKKMASSKKEGEEDGKN